MLLGAYVQQDAVTHAVEKGGQAQERACQVRCDKWLWLFALRSHCALQHSDHELPPALSAAAIAALKAADRVKLKSKTTSPAVLQRQRDAYSRRMAAEVGFKRPRAAGDDDGGVGSGGGGASLSAEGADGGRSAAAGGGGGGDVSSAAAGNAADAESGDDVADDSDDSGGSVDGDAAEAAAVEAEADIPKPVLPKFSAGDMVSNLGYPAVIKEVVLGNEATGGALFTDHKGVVEAELFEHQLSEAAKGPRVRTSWKDRVRHIG